MRLSHILLLSVVVLSILVPILSWRGWNQHALSSKRAMGLTSRRSVNLLQLQPIQRSRGLELFAGRFKGSEDEDDWSSEEEEDEDENEQEDSDDSPEGLEEDEDEDEEEDGEEDEEEDGEEVDESDHDSDEEGSEDEGDGMEHAHSRRTKRKKPSSKAKARAKAKAKPAVSQDQPIPISNAPPALSESNFFSSYLPNTISSWQQRIAQVINFTVTVDETDGPIAREMKGELMDLQARVRRRKDKSLPEPPPPPPPPPPPFVPDLSKPHILPPEFSPEPADYEHHVLPFTKRFLALGLYGEEVLGTRADQWIAHMQWIRRTALLGSVHLAKIREQPVVVEQVAAGDSDSQNPRPETQIPKSPDVQIPRSSDLPILSAQLQIIHAFTILSADRTTPIGQIVLAAANTTEVVQAYCDIDPLQCNEVLQWHVAEMDVTDHELLRGDVYSPFVFLSLPRFPDTQTQTQNPKVLDFQSPKPPDLVREARKYHLNCAEDMSLPAATARYNNLTRIVMHATLHATEDPQGCAVPELGEFVYFNAHTNRDALRYLSGDAFARERHSLNESSYAIVLAASGAYPLAVGDGMVASPVNILDVDGLHHAMPYDGWDYGILTQVHSQEPEDLLKQTTTNASLAHTLETSQVLDHLSSHNLSFAYTRPAYLDRYLHPLSNSSVRVGTPAGLLDDITGDPAEYLVKTTDEEKLAFLGKTDLRQWHSSPYPRVHGRPLSLFRMRRKRGRVVEVQDKEKGEDEQQQDGDSDEDDGEEEGDER